MSRSPNQKTITVSLDKRLIDELDRIRKEMSRSEYVRLALAELMAKEGVKISPHLLETPSRDGVGGFPTHRTKRKASKSEAATNIISYPSVPLYHAAAGAPVTSDVDRWTPTRELGHGRFAVRLHGESMQPRYQDGSVVILRERESLQTPFLEKGEIYLFDCSGQKTLKVYQTRKAKKSEIERGLSYQSTDGTMKVRVLKSLNPAFKEIVVADEVSWIGWLDKMDNK